MIFSYTKKPLLLPKSEKLVRKKKSVWHLNFFLVNLSRWKNMNFLHSVTHSLHLTYSHRRRHDTLPTENLRVRAKVIDSENTQNQDKFLLLSSLNGIGMKPSTAHYLTPYFDTISTTSPLLLLVSATRVTLIFISIHFCCVSHCAMMLADDMENYVHIITRNKRKQISFGWCWSVNREFISCSKG